MGAPYYKPEMADVQKDRRENRNSSGSEKKNQKIENRRKLEDKKYRER
jgi:hypothetical protein